MPEKLPYNHNYRFRLSIGYPSAVRWGKWNPSVDSSYSEDEWKDMTRNEQENILQEELEAWQSNFIDSSWRL